MTQRKVVLITGGAQGIGKVVSFFLENKGYSVLVFDNDAEALKEMLIEIKGKEIGLYQCDISNEKDVCDSIKKAIAEHGNIYGLINNAAISINKQISELSFDEWNKVISVNLTGPFLCTKHCAAYLIQTKGRIINIASTRAFMSEPNTEAYSASKGGVVALTHALANSLGPEVKVNSISPGWIEVSQHKKKASREIINLSANDHSQHPAGRVGVAEDIARTILFLLDPENDFITGQNIVVDGGMTTKMMYC